MNLELLINQYSIDFPWYLKLLRNKKIDYSRIESLPLMTEKILTQHYYHANINFSSYHRYFTSGTTTGKPKGILYSEKDQHHYLQQRLAVIGHFCGGMNTRACADLGTGHAAATAGQIFEMMGCNVELIDFTQPIDQHINVLNSFQPEIFFTMPMILDRLIATGKLDFQPKKIITLGDVASQVWQRKIADYFNIDQTQILDLYGSIEIGSIAHFNHLYGHYQFDPYILPEVVPVQSIYPDSNYQGRGGILLLTSFAREYFPAVRFVSNDLIEGFSYKKLKDRTIYTFQRCLGRFSNEFKHGERIHLSDINDVMAKNLPYHNFDLDDQSGRLAIRIATKSIIPMSIIKNIKHDLLAKNPDVAQMISSGLVQNILIQCVDEKEININISKRRY